MIGATIVVATALLGLLSGYHLGNRRSHVESYNRGVSDTLDILDEEFWVVGPDQRFRSRALPGQTSRRSRALPEQTFLSRSLPGPTVKFLRTNGRSMNASDAEILEALDDVTDAKESPVAAPADVAEELPIGGEAARQRLNRLSHREEGLKTRKFGPARVFWTWKAWETEDRQGDERVIAAVEDPDDELQPDWDAAEVRTGVEDVQEEPADVAGDDDRGHWLDELDEPPASTREEFEVAARKVVRETQNAGGITRKQAQEALHDEFPAGYASNERTWWRKVARPVLAGHPKVESPPDGGSKWRYVG